MYFWGNTLGHFLNHYFDGNAKMLSVCIVALHVAVNNIKIIFNFAQKYFYGEFMYPVAIKHSKIFM